MDHDERELNALYGLFNGVLLVALNEILVEAKLSVELIEIFFLLLYPLTAHFQLYRRKRMGARRVVEIIEKPRK